MKYKVKYKQRDNPKWYKGTLIQFIIIKDELFGIIISEKNLIVKINYSFIQILEEI